MFTHSNLSLTVRAAAQAGGCIDLVCALTTTADPLFGPAAPQCTVQTVTRADRMTSMLACVR